MRSKRSGTNKPGSPTLTQGIYRALVENSSLGGCIVRGEICLCANKAFRRLFGIPAGRKLRGQSLLRYVAPAERERVAALAAAKLKGRPGLEAYESLGMREDGSVFPMIITATALKLPGDSPVLVAHARDITKRKTAELALRESEERFRLILENVEEIIWSVEIGENPMAVPPLFISKQAEAIIGYSAEDFYSDISLWANIVHPEDLAHLDAVTRKIIESKEPGIREYRLRHKHTGEYHWMEDHVTPLLDAGERVVALHGVARDITERKRAQAVLWQRNRELMALVASAQAMGGFLDLKRAAAAICDAAVKAFDARMVWIGLVVPEGTELAPLASAGRDDGYTSIARVRWDESPRAQGPVGRSVKTRRPVVMRVEDPDFAPWREEALKREFRSVCALPMVHEEAVRGALTFYSSDPGAFGPETLEVLEIFARQATMAVVNAALYEEARSTVVELSAANEELLAVQRALRANIDELTRSREALRESEERYRGLVENARGIVLIFTPDLRITYWNEYAEEFFGYQRGEILGRSVVGTIVPRQETTGRDLEELLKRIAADPNAFASNINENLTKDGRRVWVAWTNRPIMDAQGRLVEILCHGTEITAFKQAEQSLRDSEARYRTLAESSRDCIYIIGRDGRVRYVNAFASSLFAREPAELVGRPLESLFPARALPAIKRNLQEVFESGRTAEGRQGSYPFPSGEIWMDSQLIPMAGPMGEVDAVLGISRVITERKQAEAAVIESEARYRTLVELSREAVAVADLSARMTMVNEAALKLWGAKDASELLGRDGMQFIEEADRQRASEVMQRVSQTGAVRGVRYRIRRADGTRALIEVDAALARNPSGEPTAVVSVMREVAEENEG